jgi:hypothetical protein
MTAELSFGQWLRDAKREKVTLDEDGKLDWRDPRYKELMGKYHDVWLAELKQYRRAKKTTDIANALEAIKTAGYVCRLMCQENAHIQAISKHGVKMSYYATSGTIAGYYGTDYEGLDQFISLLGR